MVKQPTKPPEGVMKPEPPPAPPRRGGGEPTFVVKLKRNAWGHVGALLCWPDGTMVEDQVNCAVLTTVDALVQVTVTFNAGVKLIEIREDADAKETNQVPA